MKKFNKIFNIGLNKSGTTSLSVALELLGYKTIHLEKDGLRLFDIIRMNHQKKARLFYGLEDYDAYSDFVGQLVFKMIDSQYPASKFIITLRPLEDWLNSREKHVLRNRRNPNYKHHFLQVDKPKWVKDRQIFLSEAANYFQNRKNDLLVINIPGGDGWEKLCPFLGIPIPKEKFPHENITG